MPRLSIAAKLHNIENGILGVSNSPEIQTKMAVFGYTLEKIAQGKSLLDKAKSLTALQVRNYGEQYGASDEVSKHWSTTYGRYMITVKVIRVAFNGNSEMLTKLNVSGKRNRSLSGWLKDARIMYENLLESPDALNVMASYGYGFDKINAERNDVEYVENLHSKRLIEKGEAQQATLDRDKAIDDACNWYGDFRAIARIALFDAPQQLEALGIVKT